MSFTISCHYACHLRHSSMKFTGGQGCWNGPARSSLVLLHCGGENSLTSVSEPNRSAPRLREQYTLIKLCSDASMRCTSPPPPPVSSTRPPDTMSSNTDPFCILNFLTTLIVLSQKEKINSIPSKLRMDLAKSSSKSSVLLFTVVLEVDN